MTLSFQRILLTIILLSSTIFTQITKISNDSKLAYKLVAALEKKHTSLRSKKLSREELKKELTFLKTTIFYISNCISITNDGIKKTKYIAAGCSIVSLYSSFRIIDLLINNGIPFKSGSTNFNNFMFSIYTASSLTTLTVALFIAKNYYITQLLTQDLSAQDKEKITLALTKLHKNISFDLERLNTNNK